MKVRRGLLEKERPLTFVHIIAGLEKTASHILFFLFILFK